MSKALNTYRAYWGFRKIKKQLPPAKACKSVAETRDCINALNKLIADLKKEFGLVPDAAYMTIKDYILIQDRLVIKEFEKDFHD
ncbi:MAG TPA: hypothetical protein DDY13_02005 [Cytophagales bacterium]|jgi:hypothetical protein|nr:hypothetical protein [Cytophagales bacterium]